MNKIRCTSSIGLAVLAAIAMVACVVLLLGRTNAAQAAPSGVIQSLINATPAGGTASIPDGTYIESLTVNKNITLTGVSSATTIIHAVTGQRVITVTGGHTLRLENLTITGGQAYEGGGVYVNNGSLQIVDCLIAGNSASYGGGVFQGNTGRIDVVGSRIELNQASVDGGGLYVNGDVALTNTLVLTNTATRHGGGLHVGAGHADVFGGLFAGNRATNGNGGGINLNNSISLSGTQLISNTAGQDGGGLLQWNAGQQVNMTEVHFGRNHAARNGGGLWTQGNLTVTNSLLISNTATAGGGVYIYSGNVTLGKAQIVGNGANYGGGVYVELGTVTLSGGQIISNTARNHGGGVYVNYGSTTLSGGQIISNTAGWYGGGMYVDYGSATLSGEQVVGNTASHAGGLNNYMGALTLINSTVSGNRATLTSGGGLYNESGTLVLTFTTVASNTAAAGAGGIHKLGGTVTLLNSIVAYNGTNCNAGLTSNGHNLESGHTCGFNATGDMTDTNPLLGPLTVDGGSLVHPLLAGSPAIDHGICVAEITTDQRGMARSEPCDIGAYEYIVWEVYLPLVLRNY